MGGSGSGEWFRMGAKTRVESCIQLDARRLAKENSFDLNASGSIAWSYHDGAFKAAIGFRVCGDWDGFERVFHVDYTYKNQESISIPIVLQTTVPHFGGVRWWFTCPLFCNNVECGRRVRKLYLKGKYFGCRTCHRLTYESCQESHKFERIMDSLTAWKALGDTPNEPRSI